MTSTIYAPIHLSKVKMFLIVWREGERNNSIWNELMSLTPEYYNDCMYKK